MRDAENLFELYLKSVGRNSKLLLNVPPTPDGLLHDRDVASLLGFRDRLAAFNDRAVQGAFVRGEVALSRPTRIDAVRLAENVETGQAVSRYVVRGLSDAGWRDLTRGTTIGYAKIDRFEPIVVSRLSVTIEAIEPERTVSLVAYVEADSG